MQLFERFIHLFFGPSLDYFWVRGVKLKFSRQAGPFCYGGSFTALYHGKLAEASHSKKAEYSNRADLCAVYYIYCYEPRAVTLSESQDSGFGTKLSRLCEGLPGVYSIIWCLCYKTNELKKRRKKGAELSGKHWWCYGGGEDGSIQLF